MCGIFFLLALCVGIVLCVYIGLASFLVQLWQPSNLCQAICARYCSKWSCYRINSSLNGFETLVVPQTESVDLVRFVWMHLKIGFFNTWPLPCHQRTVNLDLTNSPYSNFASVLIVPVNLISIFWLQMFFSVFMTSNETFFRSCRFNEPFSSRTCERVLEISESAKMLLHFNEMSKMLL